MAYSKSSSCAILVLPYTPILGNTHVFWKKKTTTKATSNPVQVLPDHALVRSFNACFTKNLGKHEFQPPNLPIIVCFWWRLFNIIIYHSYSYLISDNRYILLQPSNHTASSWVSGKNVMHPRKSLHIVRAYAPQTSKCHLELIQTVSVSAENGDSLWMLHVIQDRA